MTNEAFNVISLGIPELSHQSWGQNEGAGVADVRYFSPETAVDIRIAIDGTLLASLKAGESVDALKSGWWIKCLAKIELRPIFPAFLYHGICNGPISLTAQLNEFVSLTEDAPGQLLKCTLTRAFRTNASVRVFDNLQSGLSARHEELSEVNICLEGGWLLISGISVSEIEKQVASIRQMLQENTFANQDLVAGNSSTIAACRAQFCADRKYAVRIREAASSGKRVLRIASGALRSKHAAQRLDRWQLAQAISCDSSQALEGYIALSPEDVPADFALPLLGHCVLVTGAASGIGRACTSELTRLGANVFVVDIESSMLAALSSELDQKGHPVQGSFACDLRDDKAVAEMFEQAIVQLGGLDHVVSNAGRGSTGFLRSMTRQDWDEDFSENATSHFLVTQKALAYFERQGMGGNLIYVASKTAVAPGPGFGAYAIAKAAELQLARVAAIEGGKFGVRANVVNPGAIFSGSGFWTRDIREERSTLNNVQVDDIAAYYAKRNILGVEVTPYDVAQVVVFLLSDQAKKTTGCIITVDAGDDSAFPR